MLSTAAHRCQWEAASCSPAATSDFVRCFCGVRVQISRSHAAQPPKLPASIPQSCRHPVANFHSTLFPPQRGRRLHPRAHVLQLALRLCRGRRRHLHHHLCPASGGGARGAAEPDLSGNGVLFVGRKVLNVFGLQTSTQAETILALVLLVLWVVGAALNTSTKGVFNQTENGYFAT